MKNIFLLLFFFFYTLNYSIQRIDLYPYLVIDKISKKTNKNSAPKEKIYFSNSAKTKYKILITGSSIKITRLYKEYVDVIMGTLKNGKIYSNDPNEKSFKPVWGKYYKLKDNNFGVLNTANGDYEWFTLCKE